MPGRTVNKIELAGIFGVSLTSVDNWLLTGLPYVTKGGPGQGYEFDTAAVIEWRVAAAVEKVTDSSGKGKGEPLTRKITAEAALAELRLDRELGRLVAIEDVEKTWDKLSTSCRARLLAIPARVSPVLFAAESVDEIRDQLESEIHSALNELAARGIETSPESDAGAEGVSKPTASDNEAPAKANDKSVGRRQKKVVGRGKRRARAVGNSKG